MLDCPILSSSAVETSDIVSAITDELMVDTETDLVEPEETTGISSVPSDVVAIDKSLKVLFGIFKSYSWNRTEPSSCNRANPLSRIKPEPSGVEFTTLFG